MSRIKVVTVVLSAVMALSALGAASASAGWLVNGTNLVGSAALSTQALVDENSTLLVPGLPLSIVCSGHFLDGLAPRIFGTDQGFASALTFLGCNTTVPATGCALAEPNEPVATNPILALVARTTKEAANVTFKPETGTLFTNLKFKELNTCAFEGEQPVTGSVVTGAPTATLSLLAQSLTGLGSAEQGTNVLLIGKKPAYIDGGRALLTLANDSHWSFD